MARALSPSTSARYAGWSRKSFVKALVGTRSGSPGGDVDPAASFVSRTALELEDNGEPWVTSGRQIREMPVPKARGLEQPDSNMSVPGRIWNSILTHPCPGKKFCGHTCAALSGPELGNPARHRPPVFFVRFPELPAQRGFFIEDDEHMSNQQHRRRVLHNVKPSK